MFVASDMIWSVWLTSAKNGLAKKPLQLPVSAKWQHTIWDSTSLLKFLQYPVSVLHRSILMEECNSGTHHWVWTPASICLLTHHVCTKQWQIVCILLRWNKHTGLLEHLQRQKSGIDTDFFFPNVFLYCLFTLACTNQSPLSLYRFVSVGPLSVHRAKLR